MAGSVRAGLVRLSETDRTVADPADDVRGLTVKDRDGHKLGTVEDLLVDEGQGRVRLLQVEHGGILGFGSTSSFVPVEAVVHVGEGEVRVDLQRERVADAPRYDPDLADKGDYYGNLYGYYGYAPNWSSGYSPELYWAHRGSSPH